ncbi:MAG TPA: hypothetical protein VF895_08585 [Gaiellaceae bacterium]
MKDRCYLVYALAPAGLGAHAANDLLNAYVADPARGTAVFHDHFIGRHGGVAVFHVRTEDELAALDDPGELAGWELQVHGLTFALTAVGFAAQTEFTLEAYRGTSLDELRAAESSDKRYWWREEVRERV